MPAKSSQCLEVVNTPPRVGRRASIVCWQTRICKPGAQPSWIGISGCPGQRDVLGSVCFVLCEPQTRMGGTELSKATVYEVQVHTVPNPSPGCYGLQIAGAVAGAVAGLVWGLTRSADKVDGLWTLSRDFDEAEPTNPGTRVVCPSGCGWGSSPQNLLEASFTGGCKRRTPCNSPGQMSSGGCGSSGFV
jgi:hypothetical protein